VLADDGSSVLRSAKDVILLVSEEFHRHSVQRKTWASVLGHQNQQGCLVIQLVVLVCRLMLARVQSRVKGANNWD